MPFSLLWIYVPLVLCGLYALKLHSRMGWPFWLLALLYLLNLCGSELNLWYHLKRYAQSDAAFYFEQAKMVLREFQGRPLDLLSDVFFNWGDWRGRLNFLDPNNTPYWSNLGSLFNGKFMLLATRLSAEQIYVTPVFYTLSFFFGQLLVYRAACELSANKRWVMIPVVFLLPSVLFWCQGIHKDGWMMAAFGVMLWSLWCYRTGSLGRRLGILLAALVFSLLVRYFYILLLMPALLFYFLSNEKRKAGFVFLGGYGALFVVLVVSSYAQWPINPMPLLLSKQEAFLALNGVTSFYLPPLTEHVFSLFNALPTALWHVLFTPPVTSESWWWQGVACLESVLIFGLWMLLLWRTQRGVWHNRNYLFVVAYALSAYLLIGVTIPNTGALLRYRSEYTLFLTIVFTGMSRQVFVDRMNERIGAFISPSTNRI